MHAFIDERAEPVACIAADALATRHAMTFSFSLDSAGWQGDEFQGLIDNSAVLGVIVNDVIVGDELPQAVIGRNGPLDRL